MPAACSMNCVSSSVGAAHPDVKQNEDQDVHRRTLATTERELDDPNDYAEPRPSLQLLPLLCSNIDSGDLAHNLFDEMLKRPHHIEGFSKDSGDFVELDFND